uniref:GED domain-containing protein n=1 Tax=Macrostomum lignano TaxID=282301 RepID=A0A1I8FCL5_9PLAT
CRNEEALRSLEELDAVLRSHERLLTAPAAVIRRRNSGRPSRNVHQRRQQFSRKSPLPFMDVLSQSPQAASADSGLSGRN